MNESVAIARKALDAASDDLLSRFGSSRLAETAFPVYASGSSPARWLGWSRLAHAQRLADGAPGGQSALDVGAGLGTMLPYLTERFTEVTAVELDPELTAFMLERMAASNVEVVNSIPTTASFDLVTVLDVLEHVDDLTTMYETLVSVTAPQGRWIISGPTENWLYRGLRRLSGTTGEGHVRNVYDVFAGVPKVMTRRRVVRLPFGSPVPLFVVALFERVST